MSAVLIIGLWIFLTGGLHLDGWADCCDALPAAVPLEKRREILKDSRVGAFGVLGLLLLLALKVTVLAQPELPVEALFIAPMIGRSLIVICASRIPLDGEGMGSQFASGLSGQTIALAVILGLCPAVIAGVKGIVAAGTALVGALLFARMAERRLGMINGDVLGAVCELSETIALVACSVKW
jgi:adenosylcobinamide-GDP ribazoletransferase